MIVHFDDIPFSWSLRRRSLWLNCRRSYYLYYYGARGGHDPLSSPEHRELHLLKNSFSDSEYLADLLSRTIRRLFYAPHEEESPEFPQTAPPLLPELLRQFQRDLRNMQNGSALNDHKLPLLRFILETPAEFEPRIATLRKELELRGRIHTAEWWDQIGKIRFLYRKQLHSPQVVNIGELHCYFMPLLAYHQGADLWILDRHAEPETQLLHRYYALNQLGIPPERVHSLRWDPATGILQKTDGNFNISATLRAIRKDCSDMTATVQDDRKIDMADFPRADSSVCQLCRFKLFCRKKSTKS